MKSSTEIEVSPIFISPCRAKVTIESVLVGNVVSESIDATARSQLEGSVPCSSETSEDGDGVTLADGVGWSLSALSAAGFCF